VRARRVVRRKEKDNESCIVTEEGSQVFHWGGVCARKERKTAGL